MRPFLVLLVLLAGACANSPFRLVREPPALSPIEDPTQRPGYRTVSLPMPARREATYGPGSLWSSGSSSFFDDNRAVDIGDIVIVSVSISDEAAVSNSSERSRVGAQNNSVKFLAGLENELLAFLPTSAEFDNLVQTDSTSSAKGEGSIAREERLDTKITAIVTQKLPNGNLVIEGAQEVRINSEVRELMIAGIIRPADIDAHNTVDASKIAEARIAYGGRGLISDVQKPRYGQEVLDVILPF